MLSRARRVSISRVVSIARQAAPLAALVLGLSACGSAATAKPAGHSPAVAAGSEQRPQRTSDTTAELVTKALRDRDFSAVVAISDAAVREALPPRDLAAVWDAQVAELGKLSAWSIAQRSEAEGKDVRVVLLEFQKGRLLMLLSISPDTQELSGIFFSLPASQPRRAPRTSTRLRSGSNWSPLAPSRSF